MARNIPTTTESCDVCGASEADDVVIYDFMGDYLCSECAMPDKEKNEPCCDNEKRSFRGGCLSCGDPCL